MLRGLGRDARHALRLLGKSPLFTAVAVFSLALGIGASSVVFSALNAFLFQPLPVTKPEELVSVFTSAPSAPWGTTSYADLADLRQGSPGFAELIGYTLSRLRVQVDQASFPVLGERVTGNYFTGLGVQPAVGRTFTAEMDVRGGERVAVVSHRFWQRRLGGDPGVLGRPLRLNGHTFTVIGVAPEGFRDTLAGVSVDVWVPLVSSASLLGGGDQDLEQRGHRSLLVLGRLRPGVGLAEVESQMAAVSESLRRAHPETHQDRSFQALPVEEAGIHPAIRETLNTLSIFLTLVVGSVLLLACFNVANLLLARATGRQREVGVRVALGATRRGLVRQLLVESLLLSLLGGAAGLLLATWLVSLLGRIRLPDQMPIVLEVAMDWRVLAFSLGLAVLTGLLFGLAPALEATRPDVAQAIKGSASPRRLRRFSLRNLLVVGQVAASLVLLIGAGLFLRSLGRLEGIDPGFDPDHVLLVPIDIESLGYEPPQMQAFYDRVVADVARLPEVSAVSVAETVPLGFERSSVTIQQPETGQQEKVDYNVVSPGYFRTLGIPLLGGRDFGPQDRVGAPGVVIVNETLARRFWPGQEAVGKSVSDGAASYQVVAVARDSKYRFLGEEPTPYLYVPLGQELHGEVVLHVRSKGDPLRLAGPVRSQVESIESRLQGLDPRSLDGHLSFALLPGRIGGIVFIVFGLVALGLACMGIYGVMSHSVHQRRREMAIRMSVGARPEDVRRMVLRESMTLVAVGMGLGLLVALPVMQFVGSFLYGVTSTDPVSFAGVIVVLAAAAALASYFPARRATRFDPMITMRQE